MRSGKKGDIDLLSESKINSLKNYSSCNYKGLARLSMPAQKGKRVLNPKSNDSSPNLRNSFDVYNRTSSNNTLYVNNSGVKLGLESPSSDHNDSKFYILNNQKNAKTILDLQPKDNNTLSNAYQYDTNASYSPDKLKKNEHHDPSDDK